MSNIILKSHTWTRRASFLSLCAVVLMALASCKDYDEDWMGVENGAVVPEFQLTASDGQTISDASLRGEIYLLTFFNTSCKDCQSELPVIQKLYDEYRYDIRFVNVSRNEGESSVAQFWNSKGLTMPYYAQDDSSIFNRFASSNIPRLYLVDGNGIILASYDDKTMPDHRTLSSAIENALDISGRYMSVEINARVSDATSENIKKAPAGVPNDYAVHTFYGLFYDAQTKKLAKTAVLTDIDMLQVTEDPDKVITYVCKHIRLKYGKYDLFCIANLENPPLNIEDEMTLVNTIDSKTYKMGVISNISEDGAIMTSIASDYLNLDFSDLSKKQATLSVNLHRVVAKVSVGVKSDVFSLMKDGVKYADVNITNFKLVNLNKEYYLFRHTFDGQLSGSQHNFNLPGNFEGDIDESKTYVIDPNFFDKDGSAASFINMQNRYVSPYGSFDVATSMMASMPSSGYTANSYILENTSMASVQKNGYSVGVVFKAAVNPRSVYMYDPNSKTVYEETKKDNWTTRLYLYKHKFYGSIAALNADSDLNLSNTIHTDAELLKYGVKQTIFNMGVYETYYTYWIRHRVEAEGEGLVPMKYGIVRNHNYVLKVAGISGLGTSTVTPDVERDNEPNSYSDDIIL